MDLRSTDTLLMGILFRAFTICTVGQNNDLFTWFYKHIFLESFLTISVVGLGYPDVRNFWIVLYWSHWICTRTFPLVIISMKWSKLDCRKFFEYQIIINYYSFVFITYNLTSICRDYLLIRSQPQVLLFITAAI